MPIPTVPVRNEQGMRLRLHQAVRQDGTTGADVLCQPTQASLSAPSGGASNIKVRPSMRWILCIGGTQSGMTDRAQYLGKVIRPAQPDDREIFDMQILTLTIRRLMAMSSLALAITTTGAQAQHHDMAGQSQDMMQRQMGQMQDMMQRMGTMMQRAQQMSQQMTDHLQQMPPGASADQHKMMQQMSTHMTAMGQQSRQMMDQVQAMMRNESMMQDRNMQRDMDEMHKQLGTMTSSMEKMMQSMERMSKRLGIPPAKP